MRTSRVTRRSVGVLTTAGIVSLLLATPAWAAPTMSLEGSAELEAGQTVVVNVSGFTDPDPALLTLVECSRRAVGISGCNLTETADVLVTNGDGTGSAPYKITGRCGDVDGCAIFAVENPGRSGSFDTNTPGARAAKVDFTLTGGGAAVNRGSAADTGGGVDGVATDVEGGVALDNGAAPPPVIPEAPVALLLPLGAVAVIGLVSLRSQRSRNGSGTTP